VYGSYAPDAPQDVFIEDRDLAERWPRPERYYLVAEGPQAPRIEKLVVKRPCGGGRERRQIPLHK